MIRATLTAAAVAIVFSTQALAQSGFSYDPYTSNTYRWHQNSTGTSLYGTNPRTGSHWQLRQNMNGYYSGMDSNQNSFQGNHNSGFYQNYGTGRTCIGQGYARTCF
jgi:hypothetical protein